MYIGKYSYFAVSRAKLINLFDADTVSIFIKQKIGMELGG